ncbi:plasmid mobilization relaxosome protein MobC [Iodobacter fluviatilis]|uniref:plasmid mobilization relaxosome protein MobC n=1 Tax=Iodobacter fluviatilis TaxID=537 RepID=UPI00165EA287|nr:plasmid mobilization relaxosome protein MobC [Iodobacter fluviatilis]
MEKAKGKESGKLIALRLGDLKADWDKHCKERGYKPSSVLVDLVKRELAKAKQEKQKPVFETGQSADDTISDKAGGGRVEVRLRKSELEAVEAISSFYGLTKQEFIVSLTRAWIADSPEFAVKEIDILGEASYQLSSIGRNLNQIAHAINEDVFKHHHSLTLPFLEKLAVEINKHTEVTRKAILACQKRWKIKTGKFKNE